MKGKPGNFNACAISAFKDGVSDNCKECWVFKIYPKRAELLENKKDRRISQSGFSPCSQSHWLSVGGLVGKSKNQVNPHLVQVQVLLIISSFIYNN